jgi:hypothetical protein
MSRPNLEQGEGGAGKSKRGGGDPRAQGEGGVHGKGPSISQKGGKIPAALDGQNSSSGSDNLTPHKALTHQPSAVRGGGTVIGHDRISPIAGKAHSGSKDKVAKELTR